MRLGRKVDDGARPVFSQEALHQRTVADIADQLMGKAHGLEAVFDKQRTELAAASASPGQTASGTEAAIRLGAHRGEDFKRLMGTENPGGDGDEKPEPTGKRRVVALRKELAQ